MFWHENIYPYYMSSEKWWVESGYTPCEWICDSIHENVFKWLNENMDVNDWQIHSNEREIYGIRFKNVEDMIAFKLMWCK